jgi:hypothetical protein
MPVSYAAAWEDDLKGKEEFDLVCRLQLKVTSEGDCI